MLRTTIFGCVLAAFGLVKGIRIVADAIDDAVSLPRRFM